jgi:transcriptional regulator with XRE-family HTH domain
MTLPTKTLVSDLLHDFVLGDRRIAEREDVKVRLDWKEASRTWHLSLWWGGLVVPSAEAHTYSIFDGPHDGLLEITSSNTFTEREDRLLFMMAGIVGYAAAVPTIRRRFGVGRAIGQAFKEIRESLGAPQSDIARLIGTTRIALSSWESGRQCPTNSLLYRWCQALGLVSPPKSALVRVVDFSPQLLRFLQEDPARLRSLTPEQFERFVAERLDRMGYNVKLTGATNRKDGGVDLIAVPRTGLGSVVIAGQLKHHAGNQLTGRKAVRDLLEWKGSVFSAGLLVTNTAFTRDAVFAARKEENVNFLRLREFTDLKRWLEGRFGEEADWREIPDRIELAPGVVIEIPRPRITSVFQDQRVLRDIAPGKDSGGNPED